jgi:enoyl-CoA hydratase/carnithine racemase
MTAVELGTLEDEIALITLNRPRRLNAIDGSLIDAMDDCLHALGSGEYRVRS